MLATTSREDEAPEAPEEAEVAGAAVLPGAAAAPLQPARGQGRGRSACVWWSLPPGGRPPADGCPPRGLRPGVGAPLPSEGQMAGALSEEEGEEVGGPEAEVMQLAGLGASEGHAGEAPGGSVILSASIGV